MKQIQLFYFSAHAVVSVEYADDETPYSPEIRGFFADHEAALLATRGFDRLRIEEYTKELKGLPFNLRFEIPTVRYAIIPLKDVTVDCVGSLSDLEGKLEEAAKLQLQGIGVAA